MSFLGYLIQAKAPLILGKVLRLTLKHFYHSLEALSTFPKVTRVHALWVKPSGLPPQDPYTRLFLSLIGVLRYN